MKPEKMKTVGLVDMHPMQVKHLMELVGMTLNLAANTGDDEIMDDAEQFLPMYLRFVKGVLDSADLPLNVSREILQSTPMVDSIRSALTKRIFCLLYTSPSPRDS